MLTILKTRFLENMPRHPAMDWAEVERRLLERQSRSQMEALARRELGMVMPGEIVFLFSEAEESATEETEREPIWRWK